MFRLSFTSLFILLVFSIYSQIETNGQLPLNTKKYFIGISTSALLNVYPALQISHEYALNTKFRIGMETGYIFSRFSEYNVKNVRGFRLRPTVKYSIQNGDNDFFSFLIFYNYRYTKADQQREIWRPAGAYSEFIRGTRTTIFGKTYPQQYSTNH